MTQNVSRHFGTTIALLTDFGVRDGYVGIMKGVMATIVPAALFIDLSHAVPPQAISTGAWILATCYRYLPPQTVFVCVVDPGVGSERLPLAVHAGEWFFVGPDNGLFHYILSEQPIHHIVGLTNSAFHLPRVSATFQGRDLFSPAAAHIARGTPLSDMGPTIDTSSVKRLDNISIIDDEQSISAQIVHIDHFGNIITNISFQAVPDFFERVGVEIYLLRQNKRISERRRFFASSIESIHLSGSPFLYLDSSDYIAVAVQNGSAASLLSASIGDPVRLLKGRG